MTNKENIKDKLNKKHIAVIGSGISGLTTAFLLSKNYNVDLYEKNSYLGGHACTLKVKLLNHKRNLETKLFDIGFLVYNDKNYPNFKKLLENLKVKTEKSNMSFSVSNKSILFEYGSSSIMGFTNNFKNIFLYSFWEMLIEIIKFNYISKKMLSKKKNSITVRKFFIKYTFSNNFIFNYFIPMCGAIWSTSKPNVLKMPMLTILFFLDNHGLLNIFKRPKWRTITNGSQTYVKAIREKIRGDIFNNEKVKKVTRYKRHCKVETDNFTKYYKEIVFATHSDDVLKILKNPTNQEIAFFSKTEYETNKVYVHKDERLMPKNKNVWSSWNVFSHKDNSIRDNNRHICVTYWINKLQNLKTFEDIFVTLNPSSENLPDKNKIIKILKMKHPLLKINHSSLSNKIVSLQGKDKIYFVGAWSGFGFHEDGVKSAITAASFFGVDFNEYL